MSRKKKEKQAFTYHIYSIYTIYIYLPESLLIRDDLRYGKDLLSVQVLYYVCLYPTSTTCHNAISHRNSFEVYSNEEQIPCHETRFEEYYYKYTRQSDVTMRLEQLNIRTLNLYLYTAIMILL